MSNIDKVVKMMKEVEEEAKAELAKPEEPQPEIPKQEEEPEEKWPKHVSELGLTEEEMRILAYCSQPKLIDNIQSKFLLRRFHLLKLLNDLSSWQFLIKSKTASGKNLFVLNKQKVIL